MSEIDPVAVARALGPTLAERADEIEAARRLPADLARTLAEAGLMRMLVPACYGGLETHPWSLVTALEELSRHEAASGWCVMIAATTGSLAASVEPETAREIWGDPAVITGGATAPSGRAQRVPDGFVADGRWQWGSGTQNCDWIAGGVALERDGEPLRREDGSPDVRLLLFEREQVEILDTWYAAGLRGTGSHDYRVERAFVPEARSVALGVDRPRVRTPLFRFPIFGLLALGVCAVSLGIARHAIDALLELAAAKVPTGSRNRLAERGSVQAAVAAAEAELRAARALVRESIDVAWARASAGSALDTEARVGLRLAATHAALASQRAVDAMYRAGGGSSVYESSPLQRCFRDVHVASQHILVATPTLELSGRALLGLPVRGVL